VIRKIIEKLKANEILCPEAKALAKAVGSGSGVFTLRRNDGEEFEVDAGTGVTGGYMPAKNKSGKHVELDICGNYTFKVL
jgi:hypothetical protein